MAILCSICARGGSKGIPGKSVRHLGGKPLIAHSIEQARATGLFDKIIVSSDCPQIFAAAQAAGVDYLCERPAEMATDTAPKLPAIQHAARSAERHFNQLFDIIVDLDTTAPLRKPSDIVGAVQLLQSTFASNVITGAPARRSPYFNLVEEKPDGSVALAKTTTPPITRRQDAPKCFDMNASIYVWQREALFNNKTLFTPTTRLFEMPESRSLDVDTEWDFKLLELIFENGIHHESEA